MRLLLLASLIASTAFAPTADAQIAPERYYPFAPGDARTYVLDRCSVEAPDACEAAAVIRGYQHMEVLRDTLVAGEPWAVAACTAYDAAGAPTGRSEYVARPAGRLTLELGDTLRDGGCALLSATVTNVEETDAVEVQIGDTPYAVDGTYRTFFGGQGQNGTLTTYAFMTAADIGPFLVSGTTSTGFPSESYIRTRTRLVYAVVGGQTYGANPVASGDASPTASAFAVAASPSPARGTTTLRLEGTLDRPARVEVFDVVGRRVWAGEARAEVRLDVSAWPAGLYIVRATQGAAVASTRLVVQR